MAEPLIRAEGLSKRFQTGGGLLRKPRAMMAVQDVSLTIARVEDSADGSVVDVCLIPETLARTNLAERAVGDVLNVEVDHLAKLVARQLEWMKVPEPQRGA